MDIDVDWDEKFEINQWKKLIPMLDSADIKLYRKIIIDQKILNLEEFQNDFRSSVIINIIIPVLEKYNLSKTNQYPIINPRYILIPFGWNIKNGTGHQLTMGIDIHQLNKLSKFLKKNILVEKRYKNIKGQTYIDRTSKFNLYSEILEYPNFDKLIFFVDNMTQNYTSIENSPTYFYDWIALTFSNKIGDHVQLDTIIVNNQVSELSTHIIVGGKKKTKKKNK